MSLSLNNIPVEEIVPGIKVISLNNNRTGTVKGIYYHPGDEDYNIVIVWQHGGVSVIERERCDRIEVREG